MTKQQIISQEKALLQAMKTCDLTQLDLLLHDNLRFNIPNGQTITKEMDLANYQSGYMQLEAIKAKDQEIQLIGDNAIVTTTIQMAGKFFEHSLDGNYRILRVWKLEGQQWQVIAGSSILL